MDTAKTARVLRDLAQERDETSNFVREGSGVQELLREMSSSAKSKDLKDLLQYGFAIHHAGLAREDRELVEDLFADRHIGVLCTTAYVTKIAFALNSQSTNDSYKTFCFLYLLCSERLCG